MSTRYRQLVACSLAMLAFAAMAHARPLRIEGIGPFEPTTAAEVTPEVVGHRLEIRLQDARLLSVAPWPVFLPQHFGPQTIDASRKMHPAGPSDRLAFIRSPARQPWLVIGNGARHGSALVGAWHLQRVGDGWALSDGSSSKRWTAAAPARVSVGQNRWCLYLLDASQPAPQAGVATEGEAQVAWAAQRAGAHQLSCPAQR